MVVETHGNEASKKRAVRTIFYARIKTTFKPITCSAQNGCNDKTRALSCSAKKSSTENVEQSKIDINI